MKRPPRRAHTPTEGERHRVRTRWGGGFLWAIAQQGCPPGGYGQITVCAHGRTIRRATRPSRTQWHTLSRTDTRLHGVYPLASWSLGKQPARTVSFPNSNLTFTLLCEFNFTPLTRFSNENWPRLPIEYTTHFSASLSRIAPHKYLDWSMVYR